MAGLNDWIKPPEDDWVAPPLKAYPKDAPAPRVASLPGSVMDKQVIDTTPADTGFAYRREGGRYKIPKIESDFQQWYAKQARANGLDPNPDNPQHFYDYRAAFEQGQLPGADKHWDSRNKAPGHPNQFVEGENTITGQPATSQNRIVADLNRELTTGRVKGPAQIAPVGVVEGVTRGAANATGRAADTLYMAAGGATSLYDKVMGTNKADDVFAKMDTSRRFFNRSRPEDLPTVRGTVAEVGADLALTLLATRILGAGAGPGQVSSNLTGALSFAIPGAVQEGIQQVQAGGENPMKAAAVRGLANQAMWAMPNALKGTLAKTVGTGMAINTGQGFLADLLMAPLQAPETRRDPTDLKARGMDAALGGLLGGMARLQQQPSPTVPRPAFDARSPEYRTKIDQEVIQSLRPRPDAEWMARDAGPVQSAELPAGAALKPSEYKGPDDWVAPKLTVDENARLPNETDKQFAKRVVDKRPSPKALPEDHAKYFNMDEAKLVPLETLVSTKTAEQNAKGGETGPKRMEAAARGELAKRDPITVMRDPRDPNKFQILDGNGTFTAAQQAGWKQMPVKIIETPPQGSVDIARLPPEQQPVLHGLYQDLARGKPDYDSAVRSIAESVNGRAVLMPLKGTDRAVLKILGDYEGDASRIKDVLRSTVEVKTHQDAQAAADQIRSQFKVISERNNLDPKIESPDGYRDIKFNVDINGRVAEIQVNTPRMIAAKDANHGLYEARDEIIRSVGGNRALLSPREQAAVANLDARMRAVYDEASRLDLQDSTNLSKSASESRTPDLMTDSALNSRGSALSQAFTPPTRTPTDTGIPSTSKNIFTSDSIVQEKGPWGVTDKPQGDYSGVGDNLKAINGKIVGVVKGGTTEDVRALATKIETMAREGWEGRNWYDRSAQAVDEWSKGDAALADKIFQMIAITSDGVSVKANWTLLQNAIDQFAKGEQIHVGKYPVDDSLNRLLYFGEPWDGRKTNSFYTNMREAYETMTTGSMVDSGKSTQDRHMARIGASVTGAVGQKNIGSDKTYDVMEMVNKAVADHLGAPARDVQAAAWVKQKMDSLMATWEKHGQHKALTAEEKLQRAADEATVDYKTMMDEKGLRGAPGLEKPLEEAASQVKIVTGEAIPSKSTPEGAAVLKLPITKRKAFDDFVFRSLREGDASKGFSSAIANALGMDKTMVMYGKGSGTFEGKVNPNTIYRLSPKVNAEKAAQFADALAYVSRQDAVPYFRADTKVTEGFPGVYLSPERPLTMTQQAKLLSALGQDFTVLDNGKIAVIDYSGIGEKVFAEKVSKFLDAHGQEFGLNKEVQYYGAEGRNEAHDWVEDPDGKGLLDRSGLSGSPDIPGRLGVLRSSFDAATRSWLDENSPGWRGGEVGQGVREAPTPTKNSVTPIGLGRIKVTVTDEVAPFVKDLKPDGRGETWASPESDRFYSAAIPDLLESGLPKSWLDGVRSLGLHEPDRGGGGHQAAYWPGSSQISFRWDYLRDAKPGDIGAQTKLREQLGHEFTHHVDNGGNGDIGLTASATSPRFGYSKHKNYTIITGDLMTEVSQHYGQGLKYRDLLSYPLDYQYDWHADTIKTEMFAQLGRLYLADPEGMSKQMPKAYAAMKEIFDAGHEANDIAGARAAVQRTLRSRSAVAGSKGGELPQRVQGVDGAGGAGAGGRGAGAGVGDPLLGAAAGGKQLTTTLPAQLTASKFTPPKYADNLNLERIRASRGKKQYLVQTAEDWAPQLSDAKRGTITQRETRKMAAETGIDVEKLLAVQKGEAWNAEKILRARQLHLSSVDETMRALGELKNAPTEENAVKALEAVYLNAAMRAKVAGLAAEAGRALNQFRYLAQAAKVSPDLAKIASDMFGTESLKLTGKTDAEASRALLDRVGGVDGMMALVNRLDLLDPSGRPTAAQISVLSSKLAKATAPSAVMEAWKAALLSGPQTHAANVLSNSMLLPLRNTETLVAGLIGKLHGGDKVYLRESATQAAGMIGGTLDALQAAGQQFMKGGSDKAEAYTPAIKGMKGEIIRTPFRMLSAEDQFFKTVNERGTLWQLATRKAIQEKAPNVIERAKELVQNPTEDMTKAADAAAKYWTFNKELGPTGKAIHRAINMTPGAGFIVPFVRTPTNIVKFAGERTPLGLLSANVRAELAKGGAARDTQIAKMVVGTSLMGVTMMLAQQGLITGGGSPDPQKRAADREAGWIPYSIKVGDDYYSFRRLEPLAMIVGATADAHDIWKYANEEEKGRIGAAIGGAIAQNLTSKTFLKGMSDAVNAIQDPGHFGEKWVNQFVPTVIPTGVAQLNRTTMDPVFREVYDTIDAVKARVPYASKTLEPSIGQWGQEKLRNESFGPDWLSPIEKSTVNKDPVIQEFSRLRMGSPKWTKKLMGVDLTPEQRTMYSKWVGSTQHDIIEKVMESPGWDGMEDWAKRDVIERIMGKAKDAGRAVMIKELDLDAVTQKKLDKQFDRKETTSDKAAAFMRKLFSEPKDSSLYER